nr:hypothetical protein [Tanacetum cinerariifolium]
EVPSTKRARQEVPQDVLAASLQVPAIPLVAIVVSVPAAPSVATDVSVPVVPPDPAVDFAHVDTEVHADESNLDDTTTASEQLLRDDVNEENMNEQLGMLLIRKRQELAEQSRVKPMNKTQQRDYMQDFVKNHSAFVYNQGWTIKQRTTFKFAPSLEAPFAKQARQEVPQDVHAASSQVPASVPAVPSVLADVLVLAAPSVAADVSFPAVPSDLVAVSMHVDTEVHAEESTLDDNPTAYEQVSAEHYVAASTPSSSRKRRKQISKKRVTPIVDIADDALIKFDSSGDNDDDPLPYAPYAGWEMVPSPLGSTHAYYDMNGHTKHFTSLRELLHMVKKNDLQKLLGDVDNLYQREEPDTFALLF